MSKSSSVMTILRAIANGQSALKQEMLGEFKKVNARIHKLDKKIDGVEQRLTVRLNAISKSVAY